MMNVRKIFIRNFYFILEKPVEISYENERSEIFLKT